MIRQGRADLASPYRVITSGKRIDMDDQLVLQGKTRFRFRYLQGTPRQQYFDQHQGDSQGDLACH